MKAIAIIVREWRHTVPNYLTLARFILCIWGVNAFYYLDMYVLVTVFYASTAALDALDGYIARTFAQSSLSGKLLDPLVDKICAWNVAVIIVHFFVVNGGSLDYVLLVAIMPPVIVIGFYDFMTMTLRGKDEEMQTNPMAKKKQVYLFVALGMLLGAVGFSHAAIGTADIVEWQIFTWTYRLLVIIGVFGLWQAMRLTTASARIYFAQTRSVEAKGWAQQPILRWVLSSI